MNCGKKIVLGRGAEDGSKFKYETRKIIKNRINVSQSVEYNYLQVAIHVSCNHKLNLKGKALACS